MSIFNSINIAKDKLINLIEAPDTVIGVMMGGTVFVANVVIAGNTYKLSYRDGDVGYEIIIPKDNLNKNEYSILTKQVTVSDEHDMPVDIVIYKAIDLA